MAKKTRLEGRLEMLDSEEKFHALRSAVLLRSLKSLRPLADLDKGLALASAGIRKILNLSHSRDCDWHEDYPLLAFDINDMILGLNLNSTLEQVLPFDELFALLKEEFLEVGCSKSICGMRSAKEIIKAGLDNLTSADFSHVFLGKLYSNPQGTELEHQAIVWAFREGRQLGLRRFLIDGDVRQFPILDPESLEQEVESLGRPKQFVPLELSFSTEENLDQIKLEIQNSILERRVVRDHSISKSISVMLIAEVVDGIYKTKKLLPVSGEPWCKSCNPTLDQPALNLTTKILGHTEAELRKLTINKMLELVGNSGDSFYMPRIWKILSANGLGRFDASLSIGELDYVDILLLQLSLIDAMEISGVVLLIEIFESDLKSNKENIQNALSPIMAKENVVIVGKLSNLTEDKSEHLDTSHDKFQNVLASEIQENYFLVDLLNMRVSLFNLYAQSKQGRVLGFDSSLATQLNKLSCIECDGSGVKKEILSFGYTAVRRCETCLGLGVKKELMDIRVYGLTLLEAFNLSIREFSEHFQAEPGFISPSLKKMALIYGEDLHLNRILPELTYKMRFNIRNILINRN